MTLGEVLLEVWRQSLVERRPEVEVEGRRLPVGRTRGQGLATVTVPFGDATLDGIEQNPLTSSRWAKLAQEGQRIMQFSFRHRFVGNVCEGKLTRYPSWKSQGLPE